MKSSTFVFLFVTACGPAFQSDLFLGEQDAATILESEASNTIPVSDSAKETSEVQDVLHEAGQSSVLGDAGTESSTRDATIEACSCAELCSGAYPLRVCESCYREACPTWEGGLP